MRFLLYLKSALRAPSPGGLLLFSGAGAFLAGSGALGAVIAPVVNINYYYHYQCTIILPRNVCQYGTL